MNGETSLHDQLCEVIGPGDLDSCYGGAIEDVNPNVLAGGLLGGLLLVTAPSMLPAVAQALPTNTPQQYQFQVAVVNPDAALYTSWLQFNK